MMGKLINIIYNDFIINKKKINIGKIMWDFNFNIFIKICVVNNYYFES